MSDIHRQIIELADARLAETPYSGYAIWLLPLALAVLTIGLQGIIAARRRHWMKQLGAALLDELRHRFPDCGDALTPTMANRFLAVFVTHEKALKRLAEATEGTLQAIREAAPRADASADGQERLAMLQERLLALSEQDEQFLRLMAAAFSPGVAAHILGPARGQAQKAMIASIRAAAARTPRPFMA